MTTNKDPSNQIIFCAFCGKPITEGFAVDRPGDPGKLHEKCLFPYGETFLHWTKRKPTVFYGSPEAIERKLRER
jgi:hypothetical protein